MALVIGTDSWATVAEADTYLTNRIHADDWFALNTSPAVPGELAKESLLISAFRWLLYHPQLSLSAGSTDANVLSAQIEGALYLMNHYQEMDDRSAAIATGVTSFSLSKRTEDLDKRFLSIPNDIMGLLKSYMVTAGGAFATLKGEYDVD